jgi:hypothetical protein
LLNIKLASVGDVTLNVSITGTPTVNIQTSDGANIVIDKLTQGAYTERQSILANNGATASMATGNYTTKKGKFFPRGARGFIRYIDIYCDNTDIASHTLTVKLSPMPGMGPVAVFTLSVAAGSSAAWRTIWVNRFWNYDSLFIWVISDSDSYGNIGIDTGSPYDLYGSTDEVSWSFSTYRLWVRVGFSGETVGDLPVSGTVNTVEVPTLSSQLKGENVTVPAGTETTVVSTVGAGFCDMILCVVFAATYSAVTEFRVYCDGKMALSYQPATLYSLGFAASTPGISLLKYTADGTCCFLITKRFSFTRLFEVKAYNGSGAQSVTCYAYPSLIT